MDPVSAPFPVDRVGTSTNRIGLQVYLGKAELLAGSHAAEIRRLLSDHGVLRFPQVDLGDEEQLCFARTLGEVAADWDVSADTSVNANPILAEYQKSSMIWHFDGFGVAVPELATLITPRLLEHGKGGATEFADCYAAYEDLPNDEKQRFEGLMVEHSFEWQMRNVKPWPSYAELKAWQDSGRAYTHPLVWRHANGRTSLLLGGSAAQIKDMDPAEGRALICRLNEWITQPAYVYRYDWQVGDLVIWDNTGTLHRAAPYDVDSKRLMHRTTIAGHEQPRAPATTAP